MNLLNHQGIPIYKKAEGFKYPQALDFYDLHDSMIWHVNEVNLGNDIKDFAKASDDEKEFITNIMKLFTTNDVMANSGYVKLLSIFKPFEIQAMLSSFNDREITHVRAYANFTDTIGLPASIYSEFLNVPIMERKVDYLEKAKVKKYEEYKVNGLSDVELDTKFRRDVARMLAVYGGCLESVALMAQFAMLLTYQQVGKYTGLSDIVTWSIKDEQIHVLGNCWLFRTFISENMDIWDDPLKYDIYQALREQVSYEDALIDYLNPKHLNKDIFKQYVRFRADFALKELGMKANWGIDKDPIPFMQDITAPVLGDFFSTKITEYSTQLDGNWEDLR